MVDVVRLVGGLAVTQPRPLWIWGAGGAARDLLRTLPGVKLAGVFSGDQSEWGKTAFGLEIKAFDGPSVQARGGVVVVCSWAWPQIRATLIQAGLEELNDFYDSRYVLQRPQCVMGQEPSFTQHPVSLPEGDPRNLKLGLVLRASPHPGCTALSLQALKAQALDCEILVVSPEDQTPPKRFDPSIDQLQGSFQTGDAYLRDRGADAVMCLEAGDLPGPDYLRQAARALAGGAVDVVAAWRRIYLSLPDRTCVDCAPLHPPVTSLSGVAVVSTKPLESLSFATLLCDDLRVLAMGDPVINRHWSRIPSDVAGDWPTWLKRLEDQVFYLPDQPGTQVVRLSNDQWVQAEPLMVQKQRIRAGHLSGGPLRQEPAYFLGDALCAALPEA